MGNRISEGHETARDFGKTTYAPFDSGTSRRRFLKALAVAGASAVLPASGLLAQATSGGSRVVPGRIDVHHHMIPPFYVKAISDATGTPAIPNVKPWTPEISIDSMDKAGVATALLSVLEGLVVDSLSAKNETSRKLARQSNEYGAKLVRDYPGRFGLLATLPLPDTDGCLQEIAYSLDTLKADGIHLFTSFRDKWVGDPAFWPAYEELNRRNAVVFYHPSHNLCCRKLPGQSGVIDYNIDTARAIDSMLFNGTAAKFPNVRHIFTHAGGAFMTLAAREMDDLPRSHPERNPNGVEYEIKKLYFDVAHASKVPALDALRDVVPISQIVYGSDSPVRDYPMTNVGLDQYHGFSEADWRAINRGNAERLFPRLKA
jgi:predicted TIM-barrel fold metal-dependent hydrolase